MNVFLCIDALTCHTVILILITKVIPWNALLIPTAAAANSVALDCLLLVWAPNLIFIMYGVLN